MSIPGSNLYRLASRLIKKLPVEYYKYSGRTLDLQRNYVSTYEPVQNLQAQVQAVNRNKYQAYGLDFQKNYIKIFIDVDIVDINRDTSGDYFIFNSKHYKMESQMGWFIQDGWCQCICVENLQSFPVGSQ